MGRPGTQHSSLSRWRKLPPLPLIDDAEREMPDTRGLSEMYWHKFDCPCAACVDPLAVKLKRLRAWKHHLPATRATAPVPPLPYPEEILLQAV